MPDKVIAFGRKDLADEEGQGNVPSGEELTPSLSLQPLQGTTVIASR